MGLVPWHLWGTGEQLVLTTESAAVSGGIASHQVANVDAKHPTSWSILLGAQATWQQTPIPPAMGIEVHFNVKVGVGRINLDLPSVVMTWTVGELNPNGQGALKVVSRLPFAPPVLGGEPNFIEQFPAENIQINADVRSLAPMGAGVTIFANVFALCAPVVHVRPEWFLGHVGGEADGR